MTRQQKRSRNWSLIAVVAITAAGLVLNATSSTAVQGQAVIAGGTNTATNSTSIHNTTGRATCPAFSSTDGLDVCGDYALVARGGGIGVYTLGTYGVFAEGAQRGVFGRGPTAGVLGTSENDGVVGNGATGVRATGSLDGVVAQGTENGVHAIGGTFGIFAEGQDYGIYSRGPSYGVYGRATTSTGIAVAAEAATPNDTALSVTGKVQLSRSGVITINGTTTPKSSIRVNNVALSAKSMVLTTPQTNLAGVYVQAAVPNVANSFVTIYLNKAVTTSYKVAWMIVERP